MGLSSNGLGYELYCGNTPLDDSREGGSIPPWPIAISKSPAFRAFQKTVGGSTLYLNTVAVGLEQLVPAAVSAPSFLHIGWTSPDSHDKRRELVYQTRSFVLRSVLVAACDALDAYISEIVQIDWLAFPNNVKEIATKSVTKKSGKAWSIDERLSEVAKDLLLKELDAELALIALACRWRNAIVHSTSGRFEVEASTRAILRENDNKSRLSKKAGFDIDLALKNFSSRSHPSIKEVTTFLAYFQDVCRKVDVAAIKRVANAEEQVETILINKLKDRFKSRGGVYEFWGVARKEEWDISELSTKLGKRVQRSAEYQKKWDTRFKNMLGNLGFVSCSHPASAALSDVSVGRLSNMSADEFADELALPT